jgi:hypothetical protein
MLPACFAGQYLHLTCKAVIRHIQYSCLWIINCGIKTFSIVAHLEPETRYSMRIESTPAHIVISAVLIISSLLLAKDDSMLLKPGTTAPDFSLLSSDSATVKLSDFAGKYAVVLIFYPGDQTPGCSARSVMIIHSSKQKTPRYSASTPVISCHIKSSSPNRTTSFPFWSTKTSWWLNSTVAMDSW